MYPCTVPLCLSTRGWFPPLLQYLIFLAGALTQTSPVSRRLNAVCTEENIFKPCFFSIFDN